MGTTTNGVGQSKTGSSKREQARWPHLAKLVNDGQYEQVAALLQQVGRQNKGAISTHALETSRQLCQTAQHYRAEINLHQQAYKDAIERERELRQRLLTILDLIERPVHTKNLVEPGLTSPEEHNRKPILDKQGWSWRRWLQTIWDRLSGTSVPPQDLAEEEVMREQTAVSPTTKQCPDTTPCLTIYGLGRFRVYNDDQFIDDWNGNKSKSIFKYLIVYREQPIHREILMDQFWRDNPPQSARRNLYQTIYLLRQVLQNEQPDFPHILYEDNLYRINPLIEMWVDWEDFEALYRAGRQLLHQKRPLEAVQKYEQAERLYEGDFLAEDVYEDWSLAYRENIKLAYLDILDRLSQYYWTQNEISLSILYCQKLLAADNCREDAHRRLMAAHMRQGQRHLALRQYHRCVEVLQQELEVPPMPATIELYKQIQNNHVQFSPG